jgi:hypothetical protein
VHRAGREIEFRSRCLDDGRKSKSHFNIYLFITITTYLSLYRASHVRFISEFVLYATKNTNYADHLIPFIMCFNLVINVGI